MPPRRLDEVGVLVRQLERRCALLRDVIDGIERRPDAQEQTEDASAQPQRLDDAAGQLAAETRLERRQALRDDLRPECRRCLEVLGEVFGAGEPHELGAVDVDDVERHRNAGGAPRFCHQLVADQVWRHLVEDVRHLEGQRPLATQLTRRAIAERRDPRAPQLGAVGV